MSDENSARSIASPLVRLESHRRKLQEIRAAARQRLTPHATGSQIAGGIAEGFESLLLFLLVDATATRSVEDQQRLAEHAAVLAIGGFGRGEMAPYSDIDLLFLYRPEVESTFAPLVAQVVRDGWDTGLKLGHSIRTVRDTLAAVRIDLHLATALTSARVIWGSPRLVEELLRRFHRQIARRQQAFLAECLAARMREREEAGGPVLQLEPDLKRSFGGLRDLHLMQWIGFVEYETGDLESLRLQGALTADEALQLKIAHDFLLNLRIDLHLNIGKPHDVLTRDHQLRIAAERGIEAPAGKLPVETFMQTYFRHSLAVAEIADRFVARHQRVTWLERIGSYLLTVRIDDIYRVGAGRLDLRRRSRAKALRTLEGALRVFVTAARYRVVPTERLQQQLQRQSRRYSPPISPEASELFLQMLAAPGRLGALLRIMNSTGVLETILPEWSHVRCLLQFNQYHSYTVDEHTLRTIEIVEQFDGNTGPIGQAYRELRHKEILHLALLLHDAGKGFPEDHSEVGQRLAIQTAERLGLNGPLRELLIFLVHRHLLMAELAFRRDSSDPRVLLQFSHEVGSPETLKHLYVLTAADISAVGPGVWSEWKAELLTTLYERTMEWLSGQSQRWEVSARRAAIQAEVLAKADGDAVGTEIQQCWDELPDHYVLATSPERIALDLAIVAAQGDDGLHVEGRYERETGTVHYRVITHERIVQGCFHKLTGVLTSNRLEILAASICTAQSGVIIDAYQVRDGDFAGSVPQFRIDEVCRSVRQVLCGETEIDRLMASRRRVGRRRFEGPVSNLPLRVVIDEDSSDRCLIIEVFAHDAPGLLYLVARTLFDLELSVIRAQISTHFDQVVDGFYVTDRHGQKITDAERLERIRQTLLTEIDRWQQVRQEVASPA